MEINYGNKKVEKQCTILREAKKVFDAVTARKLFEKLNIISAAENLQSVINYGPLHFHDLKGKREGTYSMDVNGRKSSYRIICSFDEPKIDIFSHSSSITIIKIEEVSNHYE